MMGTSVVMAALIVRLLLYHVMFATVAVSEEICFQVRETGTENCEKPVPGTYFYYDSKVGVCQPFYYFGCGETNGFKSAEECRLACKGATDSRRSIAIKRCKSKAPAARESSGKYIECGSCPGGYVCDADLCCPTREYLCMLPYDAGKFGSEEPMSPRFFYSSELNNCMFFTYFGSKGNANNFLTYNDCTAFCKNN
uniref:BPTI/Kunitz inhibitor domain-containing protein n=1 Tax=Parascaris univalens TaxID=6257 RepID=A0A914ZHH3_PARUN